MRYKKRHLLFRINPGSHPVIQNAGTYHYILARFQLSSGSLRERKKIERKKRKEKKEDISKAISIWD